MSKKKFTLDETWRLCLSMWQWIAKQVEKGSKKNVANLKAEWIRRHRLVRQGIAADCFFCHYDKIKGADDCKRCPPRMIAPRFDCRNSAYNFDSKPIAFYNKLVSLNRKRKRKS